MHAAFAIIFVFLHTCNAEHESISKIYQFSNKKLVLSDPSIDNETLYYAACDQPPKQCTVVSEIDMFATTSKTKKCDINLKADDVQLIVAFGKDKAILITKEVLMLKATTVHMSSCKTVDADLFEIPLDWKNLKLCRKFLDVVVFDDGFEVIIKRLSQTCTKPNEKKYCGFSFDTEGKRVEGPYVWPRGEYKEINVISPIITDAWKKGYFFVHNDSSLIGVQLDRAGGPTHVKLWGPVNVNSELSKGGYSAANNLTGACYVVNSMVKCWQNTAEGGLIMSAHFTFEHKHDVANLKVHNLPGGGFLVLMITCPNRICSGVKDHYYLLKTDSEGKNIEHVEMDLQKRKCNGKNGVILAKTFVDERGLYCSARLCYSQLEQEAKFEIVYNCYPEIDFSN